MALQFLQAGDGVEAVAGPVADICAGADVVVTLDGCEYRVGGPVSVGSGGVVDGEIDVVDAGEAIDGIPLVLAGFAGDKAETEVFGEVEIFYPLVDGTG